MTTTPTITGVTPEEFNKIHLGAKNLRWVSISDVTPGMMMWASRNKKTPDKKIVYSSSTVPVLVLQPPVVLVEIVRVNGLAATGEVRDFYMGTSFELLVSDNAVTK